MMLKKLLGSLLICSMVLGTIPAAFAADGIDYVVNDNFNVEDVVYGPSDYSYTGDDRPYLVPDRCQVIGVGANSTVGIRNGALAIQGEGAASTVRYNAATEVTGDKVVVEFLFSVDHMLGPQDRQNAIKIADKLNFENRIAEIRLSRRDGKTSGNEPVYFKLVTGDEVSDTYLSDVTIYGGDTIFMRFEMDYDAEVPENGTFTAYVHNLNTGASQKTGSLKVLGDGKGNYPAGVKNFEFNMWLGADKEPTTMTIDDLKVYDATNGYAPEPTLPKRVNIVRGLTAEQLQVTTNPADVAIGKPEKCFDGLINDDRWLLGSNAKSEMIMTLPEAKTFDSARLFSGGGSFVSVKNFWLEYKDSNDAWVKIEDSAHTNIKGTAGDIYVKFAPVTAKEIKLVIDENTMVRLRELEIYAPATPPANLSLADDMTATADFYYYHNADTAPTDGVQFIAAYYDGNVLSKIQFVDVTDGLTNYHGSNPVTFTVPAGEAGQTVRLFYWDGIGNLRPLGNAAGSIPAV